MTDEVVKQDKVSLVQYGDTSAITELGKRIRLMMPGGRNYTENESLMLAQLGIAHNLNPFNGEIWLIKNKKTGELLGAIIGIKGLRKQAKRQCDNWGVGDNGGFRHIIDEEELKKYNCTIADTVYEYTMSDNVTQKRWIEGLTSLREAGFDQNDARDMMGNRPPVTRGIGVYKAGESSKMKPNQCAMFRAEKDALKRRFDVDFMVPLPTAEGEVLSRDPAFEGMTASDFDEAMGIEDVDERAQALPIESEPRTRMMGFDEVNGSIEVLDLEFEDDSELPSEPAPETQPRPGVKPLDPKKYQPIEVDDAPVEPAPETPSEPKAESKLPPKPIDGNRPYGPDALRDAVEKWADVFPNPCSDKHREYLNKTLVTMFDGDAEKVEAVCKHLTGQPGAFLMHDSFVQALLQPWMGISNWESAPSNVSIVEGKSLANHLHTTTEDSPAFDIGETPIEE